MADVIQSMAQFPGEAGFCHLITTHSGSCFLTEFKFLKRTYLFYSVKRVHLDKHQVHFNFPHFQSTMIPVQPVDQYAQISIKFKEMLPVDQ